MVIKTQLCFVRTHLDTCAKIRGSCTILRSHMSTAGSVSVFVMSDRGEVRLLLLRSSCDVCTSKPTQKLETLHVLYDILKHRFYFLEG